ncbi:hypothetical protein JCM3766R1_001733 [Sporobolomyces carnicolor]
MSSKHILPKGSSCATCKARKVKCDAIKPACTACKRSARHRHEDPEAVTCCYLATTHRKRDKSTRGIGGQSERNLVDEADTMNSLALRVETAAGPATAPVGSLALPSPEKLKFESTKYIPYAPFDVAPLGGCLPDPFANLDNIFPLPLPVTPDPYAFAFPPPSEPPLSFPPRSTYSPELPYSSTRPDLIVDARGASFFSSSNEALSSPSSSSTLSSAPSFSSIDSLDLNPFGLVDELSFYDSSVPASPRSSTSSGSVEPFDSTYATARPFDFDPLSLPLFSQTIPW